MNLIMEAINQRFDQLKEDICIQVQQLERTLLDKIEKTVTPDKTNTDTPMEPFESSAPDLCDIPSDLCDIPSDICDIPSAESPPQNSETDPPDNPATGPEVHETSDHRRSKRVRVKVAKKR